MIHLKHNLHKQTGAALVTSLVFLTILTILAVAAMNTNTLEERMAANFQETVRAFQTGESGLATARDDDNVYRTSNSVDDNSTPFNFDDDIHSYNPVAIVLANGTPAETSVIYRAVFRGTRTPSRSAAGARQWGTDQAIYDFDVVATATTGDGISAGITREYEAGYFQAGAK